jgi:hypothetical protein
MFLPPSGLCFVSFLLVIVFILVIGISLGFRVYDLEFHHLALIRA